MTTHPYHLNAKNLLKIKGNTKLSSKTGGRTFGQVEILIEQRMLMITIYLEWYIWIPLFIEFPVF